MQYFDADVPFVFNYTAFDMDTGLFVRARVYEVTLSEVNFIQTVNLSNIELGLYSGAFNGNPGSCYLVISNVYTDGTYSVLKSGRAPEAECYKAKDAPVSLGLMNFGAFDLNEGLDVAGNVYDSTLGSPVFLEQVPMPLVFGGVYFAAFDGTQDHVYNIIKLVYTDDDLDVVDTSYAPGSDSYQLFQPDIVNLIFEAILGTPSNSKIVLTQGDDVTLTFIAQNGIGEGIDLTGCTLVTSVRDIQGNKINYGNGSHTINPDQINFRGYFTLALTNTQTQAIPVGDFKDVVTQVNHSGEDTYYHGNGILTVLSSTPQQ